MHHREIKFPRNKLLSAIRKNFPRKMDKFRGYPPTAKVSSREKFSQVNHTGQNVIFCVLIFNVILTHWGRKPYGSVFGNKAMGLLAREAYYRGNRVHWAIKFFILLFSCETENNFYFVTFLGRNSQ